MTTNPVTREDPSWGTGNQKAIELVNLTEEKGHYEHLTNFLEDTIHKRREVACESVVPYISEPQPKQNDFSTDQPHYKEEAMNTLANSFNTTNLKYSIQNGIILNKVNIGRGIKNPIMQKNYFIQQQRMKDEGSQNSKLDIKLEPNDYARKARLRPSTAQNIRKRSIIGNSTFKPQPKLGGYSQEAIKNNTMISYKQRGTKSKRLSKNELYKKVRILTNFF